MLKGGGAMTETELTAVFRRLGARNPSGWAHSQAKENIPQLARFLFLRQAWKLVINDHDPDWIRKHLNSDSAAPGSAIGPALTRLLGHGVAEGDLTTVVRVMQWELLFGLCSLLDDPGEVENELKGIAWRLMQVNEDGDPVAVMAC